MYRATICITTLSSIAANVLDSIELKGYCLFEFWEWGNGHYNFKEVDESPERLVSSQLLPLCHPGAVELRLRQALQACGSAPIRMSAVKMMGGLSLDWEAQQ